MKRLFLLGFMISILAGELSLAQINLSDGTTVHFATADEAREILTNRDDFVWRMSPFDRAARMKTDKAVSETEECLSMNGRLLVV